MTKLEAAFEAGFRAAIERMGLEAFKKTSFFASSERVAIDREAA
ncbi:MAG: hypothetical protein ACK4MR_05325 [Erythrobacter cryptus]